MAQTDATQFRHCRFPLQKSPDVRHGDRSQLSQLLIGQIQVSLPLLHVSFTYIRSQVITSILIY